MNRQYHYEVLDGLRGIAALLVLVFHVSEIVSMGDAAKNLIPHGALAVDFFFCLSGFVVSHAYDRRWAQGMTLREFALRRVMRLHPLVLPATAIGALVYTFGPFPAPGADIGAGRMALTVALALLVLPYPSLPGRWDDTHSLDGPTWTLLQEYLGNITYALVLRHLKPAVLFALAVVAALGLVAAAVHFGTLSAGFGFGSFWMAPVRLAFPFLFGLWLHRVLDLLPSTRLGFWPLAAIMAVALALPVAGDRASDNWNGLLEAGLVIVLFPAIVLLGAHSRIGPRTLTACRTLGRLSYPLYILHYPFIYKLADYALYAHPSADALRKVALIVPPAMVMLGWAGLKLWDEPLRRRLSARLLPRG